MLMNSAPSKSLGGMKEGDVGTCTMTAVMHIYSDLISCVNLYHVISHVVFNN